ncbi:MAG: undecaprenyl-diphosphate phosphatase [Verrucomicrobiota bacterium]|nr:undecaprenyl-diphosphate phosphatase [Verrucomicrobiota bacterium]
MSPLQALLLGLIQGITEFFPVSSSAHLCLAREFLGLPQGEEFRAFDLACHLGTLLALALFLRKEILSTLRSPRKIALFVLALLPLVPVYFFCKPLLNILSHSSFLGYALLLTSFLLFLSTLQKKTEKESDPPSWKSALSIGGMQTLALIPGISRSGSTIALARLLGWSLPSAARFSFLLSIPAILGGTCLEAMHLLSHPLALSPLSYCIAFSAAFITGLFAVRFVFWIYEKKSIAPFAWYCALLGIFAMLTL